MSRLRRGHGAVLVAGLLPLAPAAADVSGPDDSIAQAFGPLAPGAIYNGTFKSETDTDYLAFDVAAGQDTARRGADRGRHACAGRGGRRGDGVVSLTRGELGPISDRALADVRTLGMVREHELRASGAILGVDWTFCLEHPDGELPWADVETAAAELAELLRPAAPAALLMFGEDGLYGHADHVATCHITALLAPRAPRVYEALWPAGLAAALVADAARHGLPDSLWGVEPEAFGCAAAGPATRIDVRCVLHRKLAALRAHSTQLDAEHLLRRIGVKLAARHLGEEAWRAACAEPGDDDVLARLLGAPIAVAGDG